MLPPGRLELRCSGSQDPWDWTSIRSTTRVLEIIAALLLGVLAGVALLVVAWLVGRFALPPRELWDPLIAVIRPVAVGSGLLVALGWLLRSRCREP